LDALETVAYPVEQQFGAIPFLNVSRMDDHCDNRSRDGPCICSNCMKKLAEMPQKRRTDLKTT
jgi:hypothetical protein